MAKLTLLEIVNDIANDIDSDPVNSINGTVESVQIAQIVKTAYFELMANRNWPHLKRTIQLEASGDSARPTHMKLPELVKELVTLNYNKLISTELTRDRYEEIKYLETDLFLKKINTRNVTDANIIKVTDFGGAPLYVRTNAQPQWYTSFDDEYVVMDSYDVDIENTLQESNTQIVVYVEPSWSHTDSAIPDIPSEAFPLLVEEAKSTAFMVIKQTANIKAEQKAKRQNTWLSRKSWRVHGGVRYPDYGRKG
jgi:hypothetical protein